jgi:drug/metabolite transporter (DMT)-like permease
VKQKLTSRKFWMAIAGFVSGLLMIFGYSDGAVETISGAVVALGSSVGYMIAEAKADSANVKAVFEQSGEIVSELLDNEK